MSNIQLSLKQLRGLIGLEVEYMNESYRIIEVIESRPGLILQNFDETKSIQANQFGEASRRVPKTITIHVLTEDQTELHPQFLSLDIL